MWQLLKLQCKTYRLSYYFVISLMMFIGLIGILYLMAYAPQLEPTDPDLNIFSTYENVVQLFSLITMTSFSVLATVLYTRCLLEELKGERLILLFSYPINRKKIVFAKILYVSLFIFITTIGYNLLALSIFSFTEYLEPLVNDSPTSTILIFSITITLIMAFLAVSLSIIATAIGFYMKSIPAAILSTIIMSSLICNVVAASLSNLFFVFMIGIFILIAGLIVSYVFMNSVAKLEVE